MNCFCRVLKALQQEEIMNVFIDDWKALGTEAEASDWSGKALASKSLTLYQVFTDQKYTKDKNISSINWHPTIYGKLLCQSYLTCVFLLLCYCLMHVLLL